MNIVCPACRAPINAKMPKPGSYTPKCPKCGTQFQLIVHDDPEQTIVVRPMSGSVPAPQPRQQQQQQQPQVKTEPIAAKKVTKPEATYAEATGDFTEREATEEITGEYRDDRATRDFAATEAQASEAENEASDIDATTDAIGEDAPTPAVKAKKKPAAKEQQKLPEQLGGYALSKQLGAGGMGAVYLAKQMSLDRDVALKVMHANWARDPIFLARFTREAYAAAQLNHHNVVQIYDIGADAGINFFSMEFVEGKSLGDVLKKNTKLEPNIAVGYIIQAAKGLKYAHERGMVHRDIKPDNLMLNVEGIVKVADLGLVKTRGMTTADDASPEVSSSKVEHSGSKFTSSKLGQVSVDVTNVGTAMGSPSYMAPEQCRDASTVDHRADVYSLGCTLYAMLAGRTPFQGKTAMEVINKHLTEPPPPLETINPSTPRELCTIVARTLSKEPNERYQSMEAFVAALREWQETSKNGPPRASEEQIALFENLTKQLTSHGRAKLGSTLAPALPLLGLLVGFGMLFLKAPVGVGLLLAVPAGIISAIAVGGLLAGGEVFRKLREWAFGARIVDWLTAAFATVLFVAALYLSGYMLSGLIGIVLGALVGAGFALGITRSIAAKRTQSRADYNILLKRLRLAGMDEDAVREFVVVGAGDDAENVVDCIYGPDAKRALRSEHEAEGKELPAYNLRADKWVAKFDAAIEQRKQNKAKKYMQMLEEKRLEAEGMTASEAKAQAANAAEDMVEQAIEIKATNRDKTKKVNVRNMMTRYQLAQLKQHKRPRKSPLKIMMNRALGVIFSPRLRLVVGAVLVVAGFMWVKQNAKTVVSGVDKIESTEQAKQQALSFFDVLTKSNTKSLDVGFLPELTGLVDSFNPIIAGAILILSAFTANGTAIILMMLAALLSLGLHKLGVIPKVEPLQPSHISAIVGTLLALIAIVIFGRRSSRE